MHACNARHYICHAVIMIILLAPETLSLAPAYR